MKFSYKSLIVAGLLAGATASCTDKLEIDQHGVQNYDTYYSTDEQIEAGVAEIYSQLHYRGIESFALKALLDGDFWCGGGQRGDNGGYEQLNEYRFSSDLGATTQPSTVQISSSTVWLKVSLQSVTVLVPRQRLLVP